MLNLCKKCNNEFIPQKGLKNFCSLSCRNSNPKTEEQKKRISEIMKNSEKFKQANIRGRNINITKLKEAQIKRKKTWEDKLLLEDFDKLSYERLRKRIILEQKEKCNRCGLNEWLGEKISLELEHIDGNNENNERENLEVLCPNCHSLTKTWRGRNKKNRVEKIEDEKFLEAYEKTNNIRQALILLGVSAKGGNYKRMHRILKMCNITPS